MSLNRSKIFRPCPQKTFRMDSTLILGVVLGGVFVSILGGAAEYWREKQFPSYKGVIRDFLIGSVLVLFLTQILPDSMMNVLSFLPSVKGLTDALPQLGGGGDMGPDLQVGPARF